MDQIYPGVGSKKMRFIRKPRSPFGFGMAPLTILITSRCLWLDWHFGRVFVRADAIARALSQPGSAGGGKRDGAGLCHQPGGNSARWDSASNGPRNSFTPPPSSLHGNGVRQFPLCIVRQRRKHMRHALGRGEDVLHGITASYQRVRQNQPVAFPRHTLGTHDRHLLCHAQCASPPPAPRARQAMANGRRCCGGYHCASPRSANRAWGCASRPVQAATDTPPPPRAPIARGSSD